MLNFLLKSTLLGSSLFLLLACGSGSGGSNSVQTGSFLDAAVEGLRYETPSFSGVTNSSGDFKYVEGEKVKFYIGDYFIGEVKAGAVVSPYNLYPKDEDAALVLAQFLQSIDADSNPTNGISLVNQEQFSSMDSSISFSNGNFETELNNKLGLSLTVTKEEAKQHLDKTMKDAGVKDNGVEKVDKSKVQMVNLAQLAQVAGLNTHNYLVNQFEQTRPTTFVENDTKIFTAYSSTQAVYKRGNWAGQFDFSGVGWDATRNGTLVTNQHIIVANHYTRGIGQKILFYTPEGERIERHIVAVKSFKKYDARLKDAAVEKLNAPVPDGVKIYKILDSKGIKNLNDLVNVPYIVTDQKRHVFAEKITYFNISSNFDQSVSFWKNSDVPNVMFHSAISGDSGNPQFLIVNEELVLAGVLYGYEQGNMISNFYGLESMNRVLLQAIEDMKES